MNTEVAYTNFRIAERKSNAAHKAYLKAKKSANVYLVRCTAERTVHAIAEVDRTYTIYRDTLN